MRRIKPWCQTELSEQLGDVNVASDSHGGGGDDDKSTTKTCSFKLALCDNQGEMVLLNNTKSNIQVLTQTLSIRRMGTACHTHTGHPVAPKT